MRRIHKILKGFDHLAFFYKEEFRNIFSDAGVILIFIIAVFAYPLIYGIVYSGEVLKEVPIAVIDQSRTSESRKLVRMLDASEFIKITLEPNSLASGTHSFYRGDIHGLVLIPQDFAKRCFLENRHTLWCTAMPPIFSSTNKCSREVPTPLELTLPELK